jgi:hypothetical protein
VSCVLSVVLLGRDTSLPHLLASNLLTGGKRVDLVIRGNVVDDHTGTWRVSCSFRCLVSSVSCSVVSVRFVHSVAIKLNMVGA